MNKNSHHEIAGKEADQLDEQALDQVSAGLTTSLSTLQTSTPTSSVDLRAGRGPWGPSPYEAMRGPWGPGPYNSDP